MENIESVDNAPELKDVPTIGEAAQAMEASSDAIPLGEATSEVIKEATKDETAEEVKSIGDETKTEITAEADKTEKTDETKTVSDTKDDDDEPSSEFEVPKDTTVPSDTNTEEETSWVKVGKEIGVDLKADDFEELKTAIQHKETAAFEKGKAEAAKIELEKFSPEAQKVIEFLNTDPNATIEDFVNPLRELDAVLALDDEGIVRKDLELKGWEADKIDDRIALLEKSEALDSTAYELRKIVESNKEQVKTTLTQNKKSEAEARQNAFIAEGKKENEQIKSTIEKTEVFMGKKLNKEVKDFLTKKWETGEYRKLMQSNPDVAVKSMLHYYLGEQAAKELTKESFQKGRDNIQEKLHNLEQIGNGGETSGRKVTKVTHENHFSAWEEAIKNGEGITT